MINLRRAGRDSGTSDLQVTSYSTLSVLPGVPLDVPASAPHHIAAPSTGPIAPPEPVRLAPASQDRVLPPAGWYVDPSGRHGQRYWDGDAWTEHTS